MLERPLKNEENKRYGKLLVTNQWRRVKMKHAYYIEWLCVCDCSKEKWVKACNLRCNRARSCGCGRKEHKNWGQIPKNKESKYFFQGWLNVFLNRRITKDSTLTLEELDDIFEKQNGLCYYTGDKLILAKSAKFASKETNISLDRLDNNLGYTKENIVLCTKIANIAKNVSSKEDFIAMCKRVSSHHSTQKGQES